MSERANRTWFACNERDAHVKCNTKFTGRILADSVLDKTGSKSVKK